MSVCTLKESQWWELRQNGRKIDGWIDGWIDGEGDSEVVDCTDLTHYSESSESSESPAGNKGFFTDLC